MKIVIITATFYPRISPRPMRATELAKYFASQGHEVIVYSVYGKYDYSNFIRETGIILKPLPLKYAPINSDGTDIRTTFNKVLGRLFGYLLEFPYIEYMWKIPKILKKEGQIDLLITNAVPYPIHWGAARAKSILKSNFPKVWISDCGDPYMGNSVLKHPFYFKYLEHYWGERTDYITIPIEEARSAYLSHVQNKIRIIPQGFSFDNIKLCSPIRPHQVPTFAYAGAVYKGYRDPTNFLNFLCTLNIDFKFIIYTSDFSFYEPFKAKLKDKLELKKYIPRNQLLYELSSMDFLINLLNMKSVQSPSKLIDYFLTKRPILDVSTNFVEAKSFNEFLEGNYSHCHIQPDIEKYNICNVGDSFLTLAKKHI